MMIMFRASQLYSHSFTFKHTHTHSRTDRLIFTMYDNHIPCISAVLTSTFTQINTHRQTQTDLPSLCMMIIFLASQLHSHAHSNTFKHTQMHSLTDRLIFAMYDDHIPCISAVFIFLQRCTQTDRQTDLSSQCMMIIFRASQLYSHSFKHTHTHSHSQTDRLIFTMYDDHIPCISAVFTFTCTQTHTHKHTHGQTDLSSQCMMIVFRASQQYSHSFKHTHTHIHTHGQTDLSSQCMMIIFRAFQLYSQSLN